MAARSQAQPTRPAALKAPAPEPSKPFELQVKRVEPGAVPRGAGGRRGTLNEKRARAAAAAPSAPLTEPGVPEGVTERPSAPMAFDDLDDVTRVLDGNPALKAPAVPTVQTVPTARKGTVQQIDDDFRRMLGSRPSLTDEVSFVEDADERTDARIPLMVMDAPPEPAPPEPPAPPPAPISAAVPSRPTEPAKSAPQMSAPAAPPTEQTSRKVAPLLSFRVAILATGTPGEVRLIALDGAGAPPEGAAQAILVPLGAADGELVAKLFGSLE